MPQDRKRPGNGEFLELVVPKDQRAPRRIVLPGEEVSWGSKRRAPGAGSACPKDRRAPRRREG